MCPFTLEYAKPCGQGVTDVGVKGWDSDLLSFHKYSHRECRGNRGESFRYIFCNLGTKYGELQVSNTRIGKTLLMK